MLTLLDDSSRKCFGSTEEGKIKTFVGISKMSPKKGKNLSYFLFNDLFLFTLLGASLVAQTVKNWFAMQETCVQSLGWEDPLEEGMATHSSILAWRIPKDRGAWQATVHRVTKRKDLRIFTKISSGQQKC